MAVYDDERQKTGISDDELRGITGISPDEENTMDREAYNGTAEDMSDSQGLSADELADAESAGTSSETTDADESEQAALNGNDTIGSGYKKEEGKGLQNFFKNKGGSLTSKQKIAGGISGAVIGGVMLMFSVFSGFFGMVHFAQLLRGFHFVVNEQMMNDRASRYLLFAATGAAERSRLGAIGNVAADKLEAKLERERGIKKVLGPPPSKRLIGYEVVDANKAKDILRDLESEGFNTNGTHTNGNRLITVEGRDIQGRKRTALTKAIVRGADINGVPGSMSSRLLIKRGGVNFRPFRNLWRESNQSLSDFREKRRDDRSAERKRGVYTPDGRLNGTEEDTDGDGNNDRNQGSNDSANAGNDFIDDATEVEAPDRGTFTRNLLRVGGGITSVASALCTVREVGNQVDEYQYQNIVMPMLRMGGEIITSGNQVMSAGDVNVQETGVLGEDLTDEDGQSWYAAKSIQHELGRESDGPDIPPGAKPARVGEKAVFFTIVENIPFLGGVCGVSDSISNIPIIGDVISLGEDAIGAGINAALSPTGYTIEEFMESVVAFFSGEVVNTYAQGPELGNIANYGSRMAANDQAIASGGRLLSPEEMQSRDFESQLAYQEEFNERPWLARVFDVKDVRSVVAKASLEAPQTPKQAIASLLRTPGSIMAALSKPVAAATPTQNYDYGFDEYGFSTAERDDTRYADPYENEISLDAFIAANAASQANCESNTPEPEWQAKCDVPYSDMSEFNNGDSTYISEQGDGSQEPGSNYAANGRQCFGMEIDASGNLVNYETVRYTDINEACNSNAEHWLRYRFYIADAITAHTINCYEGGDASCAQLGFGTSAGAPSGNPTSVPGDGYKNVDTSAMQCPSGSEDLGVKTVPTGEGLPSSVPQHNIRLCGIPEIPNGINVAITSNVMTMIATAKLDGVSLSGSSFRTSASQINLRREHCGTSNFAIYEMSPSSCSPPTARPGQSMHEQALAIDFHNCSTRGTACHRWLADNAHNYGLQNLPSEPWHWSTTGG